MTSHKAAAICGGTTISFGNPAPFNAMPNAQPQRTRLALLTDFPQEQWPSMDLVAEQLFDGFQSGQGDRFDTRLVCAPYKSRATRFLGNRSPAKNVDRLYNRMLSYPRFVKCIASEYDLFHVCDHSYSQLIHALPAGRAGVFCHDLDTFRCLLDPQTEPRPKWFRSIVRRILTGFQKASIVFYSTAEIRRQILLHQFVDPARLVQAPLGIAPEFTDTSNPIAVLPAQIKPGEQFILHVGSCIPRKRIDVLLDVLAQVRKKHPELKLLKVGSDWTLPQRAQIHRLELQNSIRSVGFQPRQTVAACYQHARAVLIPSEAEGFGLPVIEALACGAPVLASDIPVLREVGAGAVAYAPMGDVDAWSTALDAILRGTAGAPKGARLAQAAQFTWRHHTQIIADSYTALMEGIRRGG